MAESKPVATSMEDDMRNYLLNSKVDIFEMIKSAIMVAATDHPQEFQIKKDMIVQTLFSCDEIATTDSKVLKMKEIVENNNNVSESVLLETLSKLQHMVKSVNVLKVTGVGRSVNGLRNHASKRVVEMSRIVVKEWKLMVDESIKDSEKMDEEKGSLVVRIKMKKDDLVKESVSIKGPVTPEQKVDDDDEVLKKESANGLRKRRKMEEIDSEKLKVAKRKLRESYAEAERMKKKGRIQILELHELTKKGFSLPKFKC